MYGNADSFKTLWIIILATALFSLGGCGTYDESGLEASKLDSIATGGFDALSSKIGRDGSDGSLTNKIKNKSQNLGGNKNYPPVANASDQFGFINFGNRPIGSCTDPNGIADIVLCEWSPSSSEGLPGYCLAWGLCFILFG